MVTSSRYVWSKFYQDAIMPDTAFISSLSWRLVRCASDPDFRNAPRERVSSELRGTFPGMVTQTGFEGELAAWVN